MAVGIITCQVAMVDPKDTSGVEFPEQARLNLCLREGLVAMRGQQTACGREDGALTVALDRAPLKHKIETVDIFA
jgi:hypothetical protein